MSRRAKILIATGAVLAAVILIPIIHHYQLRAATQAYIAELKTRGEPMDLVQVIPQPIPPKQNSANTLREAAALFDADNSLLETSSCSAMKMVSPGKRLSGDAGNGAIGPNQLHFFGGTTATRP